MSETYYNTTNQAGNELAKRKSRALTQDQKILNFFKRRAKAGHPNHTPFEVWELLFTEKTPITSVRRSMTNLTKSKELVKTKIQRVSKFGHACYAWRLA